MPPSDVRPEYDALAHDFAGLLGELGLAEAHSSGSLVPSRSSGCELESIEADLVTVIAAFEAIDRHLDTKPDAEDRAALAASIVAALADRDGEGRVPSELAARFTALHRKVLLDPADAARFAAICARFFRGTEELRTTTRARRFVQCVLIEARCAAEMTMIAVTPLRAPRFARFFRALSDVANLVDKLQDVRGDRRRGEIAARAGVTLHLALFVAFAVRAAILLVATPRPLCVVAWGLRYIVPTWSRAPSPSLALSRESASAVVALPSTEPPRASTYSARTSSPP